MAAYPCSKISSGQRATKRKGSSAGTSTASSTGEVQLSVVSETFAEGEEKII